MPPYGPRRMHTMNMDPAAQKKLKAATMKVLDHMRFEWGAIGKEHLEPVASNPESIAAASFIFGTLMGESFKAFGITHPEDVQLVLESLVEASAAIVYHEQPKKSEH